MSHSSQEMRDGPCPLQGEHLRVIIPPLSSLPMTVERSCLLSVGCLLYNGPGVSIMKPKWPQTHFSHSLLKVAEGRGAGATHHKKKKYVSSWPTVLLAEMKIKVLEFLALAEGGTGGVNDRCGTAGRLQSPSTKGTAGTR